MREIVSLDKLDHLFRQAAQGKSKAARTRAHNELMRLSRLYADRANKRMQALEKAGLTGSPAYKNAKSFLSMEGLKRFSGSEKRLSKANLQAMRGFLGAESSTLKGARKERKRSVDTLRERIPALKGWTDREIEGLQEFLGGEEVQVFLNLYPASKQVVERMAVIMEEGEKKKLEDLFAEYRKYIDSIEEGAEQVEGLSNVEIAREFNKLYESVEKRRR